MLNFCIILSSNGPRRPTLEIFVKCKNSPDSLAFSVSTVYIVQYNISHDSS